VEIKRIRIARRAAAAVVALLLSCALAACGGAGADGEDAGGDGAQRLDVALDWNTYVPYHAPLLLAAEKGYFADEGLDVELHLTAGSRDASLAVGTGKQDVGWVDLSTAAATMLAGVPIEGVATVQAKGSTALVVADDSPIRSPADLAGKRIGSTPSGSDATLLPAFLKANGLTTDDVEVVNLPANGKLAALLSGKVDAISGQGYYYAAALREQDATARSILYADHGLNVLDHGFVANRRFAAAEGPRVTAFLRAYRKALDETVADPAAACELLVRAAGPSTNEQLCREQLAGFAELLPRGGRWGENDPRLWERTVEVLRTHGGARGDAPLAEMQTNRLLP